MGKKVAKVLHVSTATTWRGGEQQISYLLSGLDNLGVSNWVFCTRGGAFEKHCRKESIPFLSAKRKGSADLKFAGKLADWCKKVNPEILHCHDSHAHTASILAKTVFGIKPDIVVSRRVDFPISGNMFSKIKYNHNAVKGVFCVSNAIERIVRAGLKRPERARTIYSGVDLNRFEAVNPVDVRAELGLEPEAVIIGNTSALAPHKDYYTMLQVADQLVNKEGKNHFHFVAVGEGDEREALEQETKQLGLEKNVHWVGFKKDVGAWLKAFDLFLMTSETEGLGTSLIDALANEIPVVATDAGGIGELIRHKETGWLCDVKSPNCLAEGVKTVLEDGENRNKWVQAGLEHAQSFGFRSTAKNTYLAYNEILSGSFE